MFPYADALNLTLNRQELAASVCNFMAGAASSLFGSGGERSVPAPTRAADLTRGGGPYACSRIGLASGLPA